MGASKSCIKNIFRVPWVRSSTLQTVFSFDPSARLARADGMKTFDESDELTRAWRLHGLNGNAHDARHLRISAAVFDILRVAHDAILTGAGVGRFLPRSLVGADAGFLIDFRAGIQRTICDVISPLIPLPFSNRSMPDSAGA
jgi:hypothetical protein